jgi:hypothetical protein
MQNTTEANEGNKAGKRREYHFGQVAEAPTGAANFVQRNEAKPSFHRFVYFVPFCSN